MLCLLTCHLPHHLSAFCKLLQQIQKIASRPSLTPPIRPCTSCLRHYFDLDLIMSALFSQLKHPHTFSSQLSPP
jgi:hypothetical protein